MPENPPGSKGIKVDGSKQAAAQRRGGEEESNVQQTIAVSGRSARRDAAPYVCFRSQILDKASRNRVDLSYASYQRVDAYPLTAGERIPTQRTVLPPHMRWDALLHIRRIHLLPLRRRILILRSSRNIADLPPMIPTRLPLLRHESLLLRRIPLHLSAACHGIDLLHRILHRVHAWVRLPHLRAVAVVVAVCAGNGRDTGDLRGRVPCAACGWRFGG